MAEEFEKKFIKPIINASYPGTLAALSLAVLQVSGTDVYIVLKFVLLLGAMTFSVSAFFIFFHTIYPTRKKLIKKYGLYTALFTKSSFFCMR